MFCGSIALYLCIRKASLVKLPTHLVNLAAFGIPLIAYVCIEFAGERKFSLTAMQTCILLVSAIAFAYGGNIASLKAIECSPNPGYSLILSKSYVLFTTLASVLFLNGTLNERKAIAILAIVLFSALIIVNRKASRHVESNRWVWLSLGSFFAWGLLSLSSKYLFTHGLQPMQFLAIKSAPNVGYVNAINASSIAAVTVFSVLLFKDELTVKKGVGIVGITAALILLLI